MQPIDFSDVLINGSGHVVLAAGIVFLWRKFERHERIIRDQATKIGNLKARLDECLARPKADERPALWQQRQRDMMNRSQLDEGNTPHPDSEP